VGEVWQPAGRSGMFQGRAGVVLPRCQRYNGEGKQDDMPVAAEQEIDAYPGAYEG
jgi:hypothetical protein